MTGVTVAGPSVDGIRGVVGTAEDEVLEGDTKDDDEVSAGVRPADDNVSEGETTVDEDESVPRLSPLVSFHHPSGNVISAKQMALPATARPDVTEA